MKEELEALEESLTVKKKKYTDAMEYLDRTSHDALDLENQIVSLKEEVIALTDKRTDLNNNLTELKTQAKDLEATNAKLQKEKDILNNEVSAKNEDIKQKLKEIKAGELANNEYNKELQRKDLLIRKREKLLNFETKLK